MTEAARGTPDHGAEVTRMPVSDLRTYHRNPRQGNVGVIEQSLRVNGQYRPLVVNRGTHTTRKNEVLAGNHTLTAARNLGWPEVAVFWVDVDDDQAGRIVAADNRTADLGDYDKRLLAELLIDLPDLDGTGYEPYDLDQLAAELRGGDEAEEEGKEFPSYDEDLETHYECPRCGYEWSGKRVSGPPDPEPATADAE